MCLFVKAFSRQLFEYLFVSPDSLKKLFSLMSCWGRRNLINLMKVNLWQITDNLCLLVNSALTAVHWVISLLAKSQFVVASTSASIILAAEVYECMISTDSYGIQLVREHLIGDKWVKFYKHRTNTVTNTDLLSTPQTPLKKKKKNLNFVEFFGSETILQTFRNPINEKLEVLFPP